MPGATGKGAPYPLDGDPAADGNERIQELAEWVDARPGVSPLTTAQRDALAGADLWIGRVIANTSLGTLERYTGVLWVPIGIAALTTAARDALAGTALWAGRHIFNTTTGRTEVYTGAAWEPVGIVAMTTAVRDALAAGVKIIGRVIFNTTTNQHEWWDGAAWKQLGASQPLVARSFMGAGSGALTDLYKALGQSNPGAANTVIYTVPAGKAAIISNLLVSNTEGAVGNHAYRVSVNPAGGAGLAAPGAVAYNVATTPGEQHEVLAGATLAAGTTVVVWAQDVDVTFNLFGVEIPASVAEALKVLGQGNPGAVATALYTVPAAKMAVASKLLVSNIGANPQTYRVAVNVGGGVGLAGAGLLSWNVSILAGEIHELLAGAGLAAGTSVAVYSSDNSVDFNLFGSEVTP